HGRASGPSLWREAARARRPILVAKRLAACSLRAALLSLRYRLVVSWLYLLICTICRAWRQTIHSCLPSVIGRERNLAPDVRTRRVTIVTGFGSAKSRGALGLGNKFAHPGSRSKHQPKFINRPGLIN